MTKLLGKTVRDTTSGLVGIAVSYLEYYAGFQQYGIQPKSKDGSDHPEVISIDEGLVELVDDGISAKVQAPVTHDFKMGDEVKHIISKQKGIVSGFTTHINGCVFAWLDTPEGLMKAERLNTVNVKMLKLVAKEKVEAPKSAATTRKGGPSVRLSSQFGRG